jgi:RsiW-degrading membrane proteinase PrsW (M82 family)
VDIALIITLSFAPGGFWLWFFLRLDKVRPSPRKLVALSFFLGMIATIPAGTINTIALPDDLFSGSATITAFAAGMLLVVGPVEETSKFLAVRLGALRSAYFQEPVDGLVYSTAAALGFASLENLLYVMQFGPGVMVVRAPLSTVAHLVFAALWGYGLGQRQAGTRSRWFVFGTLLAAAALHAAFNITAFSETYLWVSFLIVGLGGLLVYRGFQRGQRTSPFRHRRNYPLIECANCARQIRIISTFCPHCGAVVDQAITALVCGNCHERNRAGALYCGRCGDRFLTTA